MQFPKTETIPRKLCSSLLFISKTYSTFTLKTGFFKASKAAVLRFFPAEPQQWSGGKPSPWLGRLAEGTNTPGKVIWCFPNSEVDGYFPAQINSTPANSLDWSVGSIHLFAHGLQQLPLKHWRSQFEATSLTVEFRFWLSISAAGSVFITARRTTFRGFSLVFYLVVSTLKPFALVEKSLPWLTTLHGFEPYLFRNQNWTSQLNLFITIYYSSWKKNNFLQLGMKCKLLWQ